MRVAALACALLMSCAGGTTVELRGEGAVSGNASGGPLTMLPVLGGLMAIDFDTNETFVAQKLTRQEVRSVHVESATVKVLGPLEQDFTFLDSFQLVATGADEEVLFAEKLGIAQLPLPAPTPTLQLDVVPHVDLTRQVRAPVMGIFARGKGRMPPTETRLEVRVRLVVFSE